MSDDEIVQRSRVLGQLAGGVAHEFNNLLTVIIGNADDLSAALESRPDLKRQAELIRAASERGAELSQKLLALSRRQPGVPTAVDLNHTLRTLRPLLRRAVREDIELRFDLAEGLERILADPATLEMALADLVLTAQDRIPGGGRIGIAVREAAAAESEAAGPAVKVEVAATPSGAAPPVPMCLYFPFAPPVAETHAETTAPDIVPARGGLVLVAEDDPFVRQYAVACLESLGYKVIAAVDGRDALSRLNQGAYPDVLFTDIVMPGGLNGWQLAEQALALRPALKVLYTSGYVLETLAEGGHLDPAMRVLNKPYRRAELGRHLHELMAEAAPTRSG